MNGAQAFVGLDVHMETIAVAVAEGQREGEVRFWGNIPNAAEPLRRMVRKIVELANEPFGRALPVNLVAARACLVGAFTPFGECATEPARCGLGHRGWRKRET